MFIESRQDFIECFPEGRHHLIEFLPHLRLLAALSRKEKGHVLTRLALVRDEPALRFVFCQAPQQLRGLCDAIGRDRRTADRRRAAGARQGWP